MNNFKILVIDDLVMVDGIAVNIDMTDLADQGIWAVSFESASGRGEIEYADESKANLNINHLADYQHIVDQHALLLAQQTAEQEAAEQALAEQMQAIKIKTDGFDYKGVMVSYTIDDRRAVAEAGQVFDKKKPNGDYYVPDGLPLKIKFVNGTNVQLTRAQFENEFLPAFFPRASAEFM